MTFNPMLIAPWVEAALAKPDQSWLIPGMFPAGGLSFIAGRPKLSRKSWLAYASALAMSSGRRVGPLVPDRKTPVAYLNLEGAERPTAERWPMLAGPAGIDLRDCALHFLHGTPVAMNSGKESHEIAKWCVDHGVECIFVDTFMRASPGADENSVRDVGGTLRGFDSFLHAGIAVVAIHHVRKAPSAGGGAALYDPDADLRGSSALSGAYDSLVSIKTVENNDTSGYDLYALIGGKFADFESHAIKWSIDDKGARFTMESKSLPEPSAYEDKSFR